MVGIDSRWFIYARKVLFRKPRFFELEFEVVARFCPRVCDLIFRGKKELLHNGYETYLAQVVDKTPQIILDSVLIFLIT